jgi:AraC-like DNA-binding protein
MDAPQPRQKLETGTNLPRHRHAAPYAALVLNGGYVEAGDSGRMAAGAGAVVMHDAFHAHLNRSVADGTQVLNLALVAAADHLPALAVIADPDGVARAAERDPALAAQMLLLQLRPMIQASADWPDALAAALVADGGLCLGAWARAHGLAAETLSRGFVQVFGVTPSRFRLEARARRAWRELARGEAGLAALAAETGFADQAHMSRAVKALTGYSPGAWRRSNRFKTAA